MIYHGCVGSDELLVFLQNIFNANNVNISTQLDDEKVYRVIDQVNKKLKKFNLMIRSTMDEYNIKKYYILISKVDNEITRASSLYSPKQLEFFKLLLQSIVHEQNGIIPCSDLKSLAEKATMPTTSKSRGQLPEYRSTFQEWCRKKWFFTVTEDNLDYITLGVRSVAELDVFIKQKLIEGSDDLNCKGCNHLSIYSTHCKACNARFHKRCAKMYIDPDVEKCRLCPGVSSA